MTKKIKKITAILFAALMVLSLAACAGGGESVGNSQDTEPQQSSTENVQMPEESQTQEQTGASDETGEENGQSVAADTALDSVTQEQTSGSDITQESDSDSSASEPASEPEDSKILVAYFSATNNTEGVAQKLADGLGADLYEITPEQPYTDEDLDYGNSESRSSVEMNDPSVRPAISGSVENMEQYDVVLVGYPIWWGEAPRIINSFLESYDFSGKKIVLFATSGGSGFGKTVDGLKGSVAADTVIVEGRMLNGSLSADELKAWVDTL